MVQVPDQSHINRVREALWRRAAGATVMVGAGFSKNAKRIRPNTPPTPSWYELAEEVHRKLYPNNQGEYERSAITRDPNSSSILELAQEYEVAFGRADLHRLLRESVRDQEFRPGRMHERLLRLPWRDVFTTNWDTLLERTISSIPESSYNVLRTMDEIPLVTRRRIVKLHGSVNGHFPLIVTGEDYRTYPDRFAPFVNTVQQAMMETVCCLIGFSGDDPNFLHWSGWVRDNLGDTAPKIYLAGWLDLSVHRRRMLEDRNVMPIDLARHPKADLWPRDSVHERAVEWILHALEHGRPYDIAEWPSPMARDRDAVPEYLEPVDRTPVNEPKAEPEVLSTHESSIENKVMAARSLIDIWSYNRRKTYPGWLTAPAGVRSKMWSTRERTRLILEVLPKLAVVERMHALRELLWRWKIQLEPISALEPTSEGLEEAARDVLSRIDCERREIDGKPDRDIDWMKIFEAWVEVAGTLVTAARFRFDADEFEHRLLSLESFQDDERDIAHFIRHERCLWASYCLKYQQLEELLEDWDTADCDPIWMMRKAALLFEVGQHLAAQELNTAALAAIRTIPTDDRSVGRESRESWALCCTETTLVFREARQAELERMRRWDDLTRIKCDVPREMRSDADAINGHRQTDKGRPFDLGRVTHQVTLSGPFPQWQASHRAVRLAEVVGLPPSVPNRAVAATNLELAATQLCSHEPELAARLVLRAARNETTSTLNLVLSRTRVATMSDEVSHRLAQVCIEAIDFIVPLLSASGDNQHWIERLAIIVEALSRFAVRLDSQSVETILDKAFSWYEKKEISARHEMATPIRNVLSRSWEALPRERRSKRILDLLNSPIVGLDGFTAGTLRQYPDPCEILYGPNRSADFRRDGEKTRWNETVGFLVRGLAGSEEARRRAARRAGWMADTKLLTHDEESQIAHALWGQEYTIDKGLPTGTTFYDWAFLTLPEPMAGLAEERFRAKWLNPARITGSPDLTPSKILWQVGSAVRYTNKHGKLSLSDAEQSHLLDLVGRWTREPIPIPLSIEGDKPKFFPGDTDELRNAIAGLQYLLLEINITEPMAKTLYQRIEVLNDRGIPAYALGVGLVKGRQYCFDNIVQLMRIGLASEDEYHARDAGAALLFWLQAEKEKMVGFGAPLELVREIGIVVATRRKAALKQALGVAIWVFSEGTREQQDVIGGLTAQGLGYLAKELRYDDGQDAEPDGPWLRWRCAQLASLMAKDQYRDDPVVMGWMKDAKNDPLPEVRNAVTPRLGQ